MTNQDKIYLINRETATSPGFGIASFNGDDLNELQPMFDLGFEVTSKEEWQLAAEWFDTFRDVDDHPTFEQWREARES